MMNRSHKLLILAFQASSVWEHVSFLPLFCMRVHCLCIEHLRFRLCGERSFRFFLWEACREAVNILIDPCRSENAPSFF